MKPVDFSLHQPATVDAAVALLAVHGDDSKVLAGGQSLVPLLNFRLARPDHVIDIGRVAGLGELRPGPGELVVGAMVRQSAAESSAAVAARCPLLAAALPNVAHPPIRARGTVGGSLAHADPAAELPAVAAALDATFEAVSVRGRREIAASDFFRTFLTTALEPDELLLSVRFPGRPAGHWGCVPRGQPQARGFRDRRGRRPGDAVRRRIAPLPYLPTGIARYPVPLPWAGTGLRTRADPATLVRAAEAALDILDPPGDLHATAPYRKHVAGVLLRRAVAEAFGRAAAWRDGQGGWGGREGWGE